MTNHNTFSHKKSFIDFIPLPAKATLPASLGENACSWLNEFVAHSTYWCNRSYPGYHEGIAAWVLAVIAARRVLHKNTVEQFTSLNIANVGKTGLTAKSTAARMGVNLLIKAGLGHFLLPDSITPQRLFSTMAPKLPEEFSTWVKTEQDNWLSRYAIAAQRGWYIDELGSLLRSMMNSRDPNSNYRDFLRTVDESPITYANSTNLRGDEKIDKPYLSILACLTPSDFMEAVRSNSILWKDGFFARFLFFCSPLDYLSFNRFPIGSMEYPPSLIDPLVAFDKRLGIPTAAIIGSNPIVTFKSSFNVEMSPEAQTAYENYDEAMITMISILPNDNLAGNYVRFAEKAQRIAILLTSFENSHVVELRHWAKAQSMTERSRESLHLLYNYIIESRESNGLSPVERVRKEIEDKVSPTRRQIAQYTKLLTAEIQAALDELIANGQVTSFKIGSTTHYKLVVLVP